MSVNEMKLQQIIERKTSYIETSSIYADLEFENVKKGELEAYNEIIHDSASMQEKEFINKYLEIIVHLKEQFEELDNSLNKVEIEKLSGYNNAIIFVLSLLNPRYEFELD